jgi:superfamily II DNA or RNA helicase
MNLSKINSWVEFKAYAESMPNMKERGDAFEHLTYLYFNIDPKYSFYDWVYKKKDVPQKDLNKLKIPKQDLGIDLIAKVGEEYHPIQCKYHEHKQRSVTFQEVSTFLAQLGNNKNFKMGYIASTADKTSANYERIEKKPVQKLLSNTWFKLDKDFFDKARKFEKKQKYNPKPFFPRDHQKKAIRNAYKHFIKENNSRGKLIFPCGAGKSLTGFWMMEKLNATSTVVAVPSLALIKQTLDVYLKEVSARNQKVKWLCICSDEGIGKNDDILYKTNEIGVPCNTDKEYIEKWLRKNRKEKLIIFTTYQSGRIIADISKSLKFKFDLGIFDEAHKTVGKNENLFSYLLFDDNISIKNRIFMTATERFYRGSFDQILTMDDEDDYGDIFSQMSFKEAIEKDLLTDYKIITIKVDNKEIADFIKNNNLVKSNEKWGKESEARSLASMIALRKAMNTYPIKNAVSFHSSIERAIRNKHVNDEITNTYNYKPIQTFHVSGKDHTSKRESIIDEFANSKRSLITNSRCLTEGVDVPNIDCILFADPRRSKVDIVQALGRALRKKEGKDWGYVILPIMIDEISMEPNNEQFQDILNIVSALAASDERLIEYFKDKSQKSLRLSKGREERFKIDPSFNIKDELINNIELKLWKRIAKLHIRDFEEARSFVHKLNLKSTAEWHKYCTSGEKPDDIPFSPRSRYKNEGWISMGDWLGTGSVAHKYKTFSPFEEARSFVRLLKLESQSDWKKYCMSGEKPDDISASPWNTYKDKGWVSLGDWLGTKVIAAQYKIFRPFEEARSFVHKLNLKSTTEWREYIKLGKKPDDIPSIPRRIYKDKGWISTGDWLGTGVIATSKRKYRPFKESRSFIHKLNLKNTTEWKKYYNSGKMPDYIPTIPRRIYKDKGWVSMGDWLGTGTIATHKIKYRPFKEARSFVRLLKFKTLKEWDEYCKSGKKPDDIPTFPRRPYKNDWISSGDWLGNGRDRNYKSFKESRSFVHKLNLKSHRKWLEYCKSGKKPTYIPYSPDRTYKNEGWINWMDWLGK